MKYQKSTFPLGTLKYAETTAPDMERFFTDYIGTTADMIKDYSPDSDPAWRFDGLKEQLEALKITARLAGFDGDRMVRDALAERRLTILS